MCRGYEMKPVINIVILWSTQCDISSLYNNTTKVEMIIHIILMWPLKLSSPVISKGNINHWQTTQSRSIISKD